MKKNIKGILSLSLATMALVSFASPAAAEAATESAKTDGKASFIPLSGNIDTIKPGTDEKIEVDGGNTEPIKVGSIQLIHIPDFDFGTNETSVNSQEYAALNEKYKNKGGADKYAIPHFVQVGDVSGIQGTKWKVTVEQDALFKADEHSLRGTRINIYNQTLTNNVHSTNVADVVTGLSIPSSSSIQIPVKGVETTGAIPVLTAKASKTDETTTNGTISSVVFADNYDAANFGAAGPAVNSKNEDVRLSVPQSDGVQTKNYSAKLTWSLTVEP
ncbi:WxL domain-containing protein [Erwinia sp. CPCC 100877]|nr:WxL domain-containing protein [Erwinia sp. CPCC 100877]